jgi:hypothetical protein
MIGFCGIDQFVQNGSHHNRVNNVCFFYCSDGYVWFNGGETNTAMVMFILMEVNESLTVLNSKSMIRSPRLKLELLLDS